MEVGMMNDNRVYITLSTESSGYIAEVFIVWADKGKLYRVGTIFYRDSKMYFIEYDWVKKLDVLENFHKEKIEDIVKYLTELYKK